MSSFLFALQYLTRIPIGSIPFNEKQLGRSGMFFPLIGLILGGLLLLINWLVGRFYPDIATTAILLVAMVILTGGIHLDGFIDTMDGIFSGRPRDEKMEIMRDSRVGAFGVLGVICLLLLKYSFLFTVIKSQGYSALIMMAVFSRWAMVWAIRRFPYARAEGMGVLFSKYIGRYEIVTATLITVGVALGCGSLGGLALFVVSAIFAQLVCVYFNSVLGGLTGDTYGALNELTEVFVLAVYIPVINNSPKLFFNVWF